MVLRCLDNDNIIIIITIIIIIIIIIIITIIKKIKEGAEVSRIGSLWIG